jgi:hypothetical protein
MIVLPYHYDNEKTIIIRVNGEVRVINGCQDFTLDQADAVIYEYDVSKVEWEQVLEAIDRLGEADSDFGTFLVKAQHTMERYGETSVHNDELMVIARHGTDEHRDNVLRLAAKSAFVLASVAKYGNDNHRDRLLNSDYTMVLCAIAKFGNEAHRDALINDSFPMVRINVARFGSKNQCTILINDEHPAVRKEASKRLSYLNKQTGE